MSRPQSPRRLSTHPNEPFMVQRNTSPSSRQLTEPAESPLPQERPNEPTPVQSRRPSPEPSVIPIAEPSRKIALTSSRQPSPLPSRRPSEAPPKVERLLSRNESEPTSRRTSKQIDQQATVLEPDPDQSVRRVTTLPAEPDANSRKPSVQNRDTWRHSLGRSEAAPNVIQELQNKAAQEEKNIEEGVKKAVERAPTPPPRAATSASSRIPTAKMPSRANTTPLVEMKDGEGTPDVKVNV